MSTNNNVLDRIRSSLGQANQGGSFQVPSNPTPSDYLAAMALAFKAEWSVG